MLCRRTLMKPLYSPQRWHVNSSTLLLKNHISYTAIVFTQYNSLAMIKTGLFYPFTFTSCTSCNHQNSETHQTRIIQYKALDQLTQNDCLPQERLDNYLKIFNPVFANRNVIITKIIRFGYANGMMDTRYDRITRPAYRKVGIIEKPTKLVYSLYCNGIEEIMTDQIGIRTQTPLNL